MKRVYISEAVAESKEEFVFLEFLYNMKEFLKSLLTNPLSCDVNDFFKEMGYTKQDLVKTLLDRGVIIKSTSIDTVEDDATSSSGEQHISESVETQDTESHKLEIKDKDVFTVSYKIPKRNFDRKMRRLYSSIFEENTIDEATGCASAMGGGMPDDVDGNYEKKLEKTGMQKKIFVNEQQFKMLMEMGAADAGNYQYDVPLEFNGGNDPAYDHSNIIRRSFGNTRKKKVKK